jgi:AraC-like DNA-binding protein
MHLERLTFKLSPWHAVVTYPPGAVLAPRTLRDYEFVWIITGNVTYVCDGESYPAPPGTVILARPGMRDSYIWDPEKQTRHGFYHFALTKGSAGLPNESQWPLIRQVGDGDIILPLLHHLDWLLHRKPPAWEELVQGAMRQALAAFIFGSYGTVANEPMAQNESVTRVMKFVQRRWSAERMEPISLAEMTAASGISRGHLIRLFRGAIGAGPVEVLRLLRLERAASLLARTNFQVQRVSEQCGFPNAFHFSRSFRSVYGRSPRQFRDWIDKGNHVPNNRLLKIRQLSAELWGGARPL